MIFFDYISKDEITALITDLISIESHKDQPLFESAVAEYIQNRFKKEEIETELEQTCPGFPRPNVYAYLGGKSKSPELMLNGHIDTVPGFNMDYPAYTPFIRDGKIYGRGSADMKGGITGFMAAFIAAKRAGLVFRKSAMFAGVTGEEECSQGTEHLIKTGYEPVKVVISEPTEMSLCTAHKGFEWVEVTMIGRSCHGSKPWAGKNAIYAAARLCDLIQKELIPELESHPDPLLGPGTVCVGVVNGGHDPNIVPDRCTIQLDRRFMVTEPLETVYAQIISLAQRAADEYGCKFEWRPMDHSRPSMIALPHAIDPNDDYVQSTLKILEEVTHKEQEPVVWPCGWTDAGLLSNYTKAKCIVVGPGEVACAHNNDEYCSLEQIYQASELYFKMLQTYCC